MITEIEKNTFCFTILFIFLDRRTASAISERLFFIKTTSAVSKATSDPSIGFIGSYISGMLGIGGSIIKYPMLLYIPPIFGLTAFSAHEVSGISAVQVLFASISGVWAYRKYNWELWFAVYVRERNKSCLWHPSHHSSSYDVYS